LIDDHGQARQRTTSPIPADEENIRFSFLFHLLVQGRTRRALPVSRRSRPAFLKSPTRFLLLGIHGNHRPAIGLKPAYFAVNELKLSAAVRMLQAFSGFLVRL